MVGIILATHGNFATGIQQSASMIFGEQPNVAAVTLQPNEGPDDVRKKMEEAVASFEDPEQVLILVDLQHMNLLFRFPEVQKKALRFTQKA